MVTRIFVTSFILTGFALLNCTAVEAVQLKSGGGYDGTNQRSIREWVKCDGVTDDAEGTSKAFSAAKGHAFVLLVDCPVFIHIGTDITRPIFIDSGTTVRFADEGLFITDNVSVPTWIIANSNDIELMSWRVKYVGSMPTSFIRDGYEKDGVHISAPGKVPGSGAFNDQTLKAWLVAHRNIVFDKNSGPIWTGPTNLAAMFYFVGPTHDVRVDNMHLFVPVDAGGNQFIPTCFASAPGYNDSQTINGNATGTVSNASIPYGLHFSDLDIDGSYMGWTGGLKNSTFKGVKSHRYGDLQDAQGATVGGEGKWFAPPHLLYFGRYPGFDNVGLEISDVVDYGIRIGQARDKSVKDLSGYASSLKIGADDSIVKNYITDRLDGAIDLLPSRNLRIVDFKGTYDSSFLNNLFPGIRFPADGGYKHISIENLSLVDRAPTSSISPIFGLRSKEALSQNSDIVFSNVNVTLNRWSGPGSIDSGLGTQLYGLRTNYRELAPALH